VVNFNFYLFLFSLLLSLFICLGFFIKSLYLSHVVTNHFATRTACENLSPSSSTEFSNENIPTTEDYSKLIKYIVIGTIILVSISALCFTLPYLIRRGVNDENVDLRSVNSDRDIATTNSRFLLLTADSESSLFQTAIEPSVRLIDRRQTFSSESDLESTQDNSSEEPPLPNTNTENQVGVFRRGVNKISETLNHLFGRSNQQDDLPGTSTNAEQET
jgi:hypothetical protein